MTSFKLRHPTTGLAIRPDPNSPLFRTACCVHSLQPTERVCDQSLHHVAGSWPDAVRCIHPDWAWDLQWNCLHALPQNHICDSLCRLFANARELPPDTAVSGLCTELQAQTSSSLHHDVIYTHAGDVWDAHWSRSPVLEVNEVLARRWLDADQYDVAHRAMALVRTCYEALQKSQYLLEVSCFLEHYCDGTGNNARIPKSAIGAGFGAFVNKDEVTSFAKSTAYQVALFFAIARMFQIPAGSASTYDPKYSEIDVVLLASLGMRAYMRCNYKELAYYKQYTVPTIFYAPGAEQGVIHQAIKMAKPTSNLVLLAGDPVKFNIWKYPKGEEEKRERISYEDIKSGRGLVPFVKHRRHEPIPRHCDAEHCCLSGEFLQWIPSQNVRAYENAVIQREEVVTPNVNSADPTTFYTATEPVLLEDDAHCLFIRTIPLESTEGQHLKGLLLPYRVVTDEGVSYLHILPMHL